MSNSVDGQSPGKGAQRWEDIEGFILDLDGTVYLGDQLLPGSREFFRWMTERGKRYVVLTNNSSRDGDHYRAKLEGMGLPVEAGQVVTSGQVTAQWMARRHPGAIYHILGTGHLVDEFRRAGLRVMEDLDREGVDEGAEALKAEADHIVILGFDTTLTYARLERACLLIRAGAPYFATHPDDVCPTPRGLIPDCGAITALVETATGRKPQRVFGKPGPEMVDAALERLDLLADRVAMVGDRLYTDMRMARDNGLLAVLVLSGETDRGMLKASDLEPDLVVEDLGDLAHFGE